MQIDHDADEWPYAQLAGHFRGQIKSGELVPGQRLPSLNRLNQETGLSPKTIQKAMRLLESEGLVRVVPSRGTYVSKREGAG